MSEPIPMLLWCPLCAHRHVDEGEFATKPHHTHSCQLCGLTWRPAVVATVGVTHLPGFKDLRQDGAPACGHQNRKVDVKASCELPHGHDGPHVLRLQSDPAEQIRKEVTVTLRDPGAEAMRLLSEAVCS